MFTLSERHCLKALEILIMGPSGRVNPTDGAMLFLLRQNTFLYISGTLSASKKKKKKALVVLYQSLIINILKMKLSREN